MCLAIAGDLDRHIQWQDSQLIRMNPYYIQTCNMSAIALAKDDHYHSHTKHINICFHFICFTIESGKLKLIFCPTADMTADIFTKALDLTKAIHFASSMGLRSV